MIDLAITSVKLDPQHRILGWETSSQMFQRILAARKQSISLVQLEVFVVVESLLDGFALPPTATLDEFLVVTSRTLELSSTFEPAVRRKRRILLPRGLLMLRQRRYVRKLNPFKKLRVARQTRKLPVPSSSGESSDGSDSSASQQSTSSSTSNSTSSTTSSSTSSSSKASSNAPSSNAPALPPVPPLPPVPRRSYFAKEPGIPCPAVDKARRRGGYCRLSSCKKVILVGAPRIAWHGSGQRPNGYICPACVVPALQGLKDIDHRKIVLASIVNLKIDLENVPSGLQTVAISVELSLRAHFL